MSDSPKSFKFNQAIAMLVLVLNAFAMQSTYADSFDDVVKQAVIKDVLTAAQSEQFQAVTTVVSQLSGLTINDAEISDGVIIGEVEFLKLKWRMIAFSDGALDNTFVTFAPKKNLLFSELFQNAPGIKLLDIVRFDQQMLVFSLQDIDLKSKDLPDVVRSKMGRFFDNPQYDLKIQKGLTQLGSFNLKDVSVLNNALEFLGGESGTIKASVALKGDNVLDDLLKGKPPVPHIKLTAPMPTFRPSIAGKLTLPADLKMALVGELEGKQASLGYFGTTAFDVGGKTVGMNLDTGVTLRAGAPEFLVTASTLKGEPLKKAFGVNWLTLEDYRITFGQEGDALKMGFGGKTTLGKKQFDVFALGATSVKTLGVPIPEKIQLSINDGPDNVGSLSLRDIASIFIEMLSATGKKVELPKAFPDLAITGIEKGKGPSINLVLKAAGNAGLDISGGLRVLDTELGVIERAFVQADTGIEIKARTAKLGVGPIKFPTADLDVSLKRDGLNLTEPRAIISAKALSLFGSDNGFDLIMRPNQFDLKALSDFGSLFKFNFMASTEEQIKNLKHLENTDFQIAAELSSDPSKWIRTEGKKAVAGAFSPVSNVLGSSQASLKETQVKVATLDDSISEMKAKINRSKVKRTDTLKSASEEVDKLDTEITKLQTQIDSLNNSMESCNQSSKHSVLSLPAIAECLATNVKLGLEIVGLETAKGTLIASREVAQTTLTIIAEGVKGLPVELDPRISGLIIAREAAMLTLKAAEETVKGLNEFIRILPEGIGIVGSPDIFALENSSIQGSMRNAVNGKPVLLDMNFRMLGERFQQRLAFSMTDMAFNARQFEVIALGAAVNSVMKLGQKARIIPYSLLTEVQGIYNLKRLEVDKALYLAMDSNPIKPAEGDLNSIDEVIELQYKEINKVRLQNKLQDVKKFRVTSDKKQVAIDE